MAIAPTVTPVLVPLSLVPSVACIFSGLSLPVSSCLYYKAATRTKLQEVDVALKTCRCKFVKVQVQGMR